MNTRTKVSMAVAGVALAAVTGCGTAGSRPAANTSPAPRVTKTVRVNVPVTSTAAPATQQAAPAQPPTPAAQPAQPQFTNAAAVVSQYYQDITDHDYQAAWQLGGYNFPGASYASFAAGYATTASVQVGTENDFGASQVYAVIYATQTDGTVKTYSGTYTVHDGIITGASIQQDGQ